MRIRNLKESDFHDLLSLISGIYKESGEALLLKKAPDEQNFRPIFDAKLSGIKADLVIDIVAVEGNKITGECEVVRKGYKVGLIGLVVGKAQRNKRIGRRLLERSYTIAKKDKIEALTAEVSQKNKKALSFFLKNGFFVIGVSKKPGFGKVILLHRELD